MKPLILTLILIISLMPITTFAESISVDFEGNPYDVEYTGDGVTISGIQTDADFISLILDVDVTGSPGILEITLQRGFIDSQFEGEDDAFIVIADGDEPTFEEIDTNSESRTLQIELAAGTDEVEIIGTVFGSEPVPTIPPMTGEEPETEEPQSEEPPVETPSKEEPQSEEPPVETPSKEEPQQTTEKPKVECGEGTILKDGACVVDERCGPGTVLKEGICVAAPEEPTVSQTGIGKQLVIGVVAAFIISLIVIAFLYIISRGSRSTN